MIPRIGVVGTGVLGSRHAATLAGLARRPSPLLTFAGVFDRRLERAQAVAREHGTQAFERAESLFEAADAVVVAVPTIVHADVTLAALENGCDVLVEKPIADTPAVADRMLAAARKAGRRLFVGHSERFNAAVRVALPHLTRAYYVEARRVASFTPRATDVDVVLDLMIHDIDLALAFVGEEPSRIDAVGISVLTGSEDLANARLEFPSGAVANLTTSRVSPDRMRKIRVFGDHTYVSMDCLTGTAEAVVADPRELAAAAQVYAAHAAHAAGAAATAPATLPDWSALVHRQELDAGPEPVPPLALELEAFAAACAGVPEATIPRALTLATGEEGRAALAVACRVRDAMRERSARWFA
ncbi:MAG: Gfo/Idh/MocA family protein [Candidatus Eiseniibacteriota bacterium]